VWGTEPHAPSGELQAQVGSGLQFTLGPAMGSRTFALVASALLGFLAVSCDLAPSPAPVDPTAVGLQSGDLPAPLHRCRPSGDVDGYLRFLKDRNRPAYDELAANWRDLQAHGAAKGALTVYAQQTEACSARIGTGDGPNVTTVVARYRDEDTAAKAYARGMFGFATPSDDQEVPDTARGAATGIGRNAWVLDRSVGGRSLIVAEWQHHAIGVLFIAVDSDPLHAKQAIATVDGRIP
jgi:hypothetical protein